jgi:hypothetical protein
MVKKKSKKTKKTKKPIKKSRSARKPKFERKIVKKKPRSFKKRVTGKKRPKKRVAKKVKPKKKVKPRKKIIRKTKPRKKIVKKTKSKKKVIKKKEPVKKIRRPVRRRGKKRKPLKRIKKPIKKKPVKKKPVRKKPPKRKKIVKRPKKRKVVKKKRPVKKVMLRKKPIKKKKVAKPRRPKVSRPRPRKRASEKKMIKRKKPAKKRKAVKRKEPAKKKKVLKRKIARPRKKPKKKIVRKAEPKKKTKPKKKLVKKKRVIKPRRPKVSRPRPRKRASGKKRIKLRAYIGKGTLDQLFESQAKVKLLRFFFRNAEEIFQPEQIFKRLRSNIALLRQEMKKLEKLGLLKQRRAWLTFEKKRGGITREKKTVWHLNPNFDFFNELRSLVLKSAITSKDDLVERAKKLGNIKLLLLTGVFTGEESARADLLIVGDRINQRKLNGFIKDVEADTGKEINCAVMTTKEFSYRYDMYDQFVRKLIEGKSEILIKSIELW